MLLLLILSNEGCDDNGSHLPRDEERFYPRIFYNLGTQTANFKTFCIKENNRIPCFETLTAIL